MEEGERRPICRLALLGAVGDYRALYTAQEVCKRL